MSRRQGTPQGGYWFARAIRNSALRPIARLLALTIASEAKTETGKLLTSLTHLALQTGLSLSSVKKARAELADGGYLMWRTPVKWAQLRGDTNEYTTLIPPGEPTSAPPEGRAPHALPLGRHSDEPRAPRDHSHYRTTGAAGAAPLALRGTPAHRPLPEGCIEWLEAWVAAYGTEAAGQVAATWYAAMVDHDSDDLQRVWVPALEWYEAYYGEEDGFTDDGDIRHPGQLDHLRVWVLHASGREPARFLPAAPTHDTAPPATPTPIARDREEQQR